MSTRALPAAVADRRSDLIRLAAGFVDSNEAAADHVQGVIDRLGWRKAARALQVSLSQLEHMMRDSRALPLSRAEDWRDIRPCRQLLKHEEALRDLVVEIIRNRKGATLTDIADALGLKRNTLQRLGNGTGRLMLKHADAIASALSAKPSDLQERIDAYGSASALEAVRLQNRELRQMEQREIDVAARRALRRGQIGGGNDV